MTFVGEGCPPFLSPAYIVLAGAQRPPRVPAEEKCRGVQYSITTPMKNGANAERAPRTAADHTAVVVLLPIVSHVQLPACRENCRPDGGRFAEKNTSGARASRLSEKADNTYAALELGRRKALSRPRSNLPLPG